MCYFFIETAIRLSFYGALALQPVWQQQPPPLVQLHSLRSSSRIAGNGGSGFNNSLSGSSGDSGHTTGIVRAVSLSLVVRPASAVSSASSAAALAASTPIPEADISPAVRAFITQSLVNRHAVIGQEMLAQLPDQRSFLIECVAALPSSNQSKVQQNQHHMQQQNQPQQTPHQSEVQLSNADEAAVTSQMASLSITTDKSSSHESSSSVPTSSIPHVYFVDDNTRFVWLAKVPTPAHVESTATAAADSEVSPSADGSVGESNSTLSHQTETRHQSLPPKPATDAFADIGGLGAQIESVREMVELPLRCPHLFARFGLRAPKGVLLHGPYVS